MREGLRTNVAHVILGRAKVEALLVALERLNGGENLRAVWAGIAQPLVDHQDMIPQLPLRLMNRVPTKMRGLNSLLILYYTNVPDKATAS